MGNLKEKLMQELKNYPSEIVEIVRRIVEQREEEVIEHMRSVSIVHASDALLEAELSDEKIILLLQKHYDLCRSEAEKVLLQAKNRAAK